MLMEALSGGRAISLPAQATAGAKYMARRVGAYSAVRRQFGRPIGAFEGIEEPVARIAGLTYLMDAARVFTCGAVDSGRRPAVVSALVKYQLTAMMRGLAADAMDVMGGAGIMRGRRNHVADAWIGAPIGITVEGANILTRTLIVFGQGAMRCHPHARDLLDAIRDDDAAGFRRALLRQARRFVGNTAHAVALGLSRGRLARAPVGGPTAVYYRRLGWAAARFAVYADLAMFVIGGRLKARGKLSGRFADQLSWLYLGSAVLRRYEAEGRRDEDLPLVRWALDHCLARLQEGFEGILANFGTPILGALLRGPELLVARLLPIGGPPSDADGAAIAAILRQPGELRDRLTAGLFLAADESEAGRRLEEAFELATAAEPLRARVRRGEPREALTDAERRLLDRADTAIAAATEVDSFTLEELRDGVERAAQAPAAAAEVA